MTDNAEQDEALLYRIRVTLTDRLSAHVSTPPEQRAEVSRALTDAITPDIREALTAARAEVEKLRRQVMGYRGLKDTYLRERNAAHAELIKAENLIERLCDDREAGQGVVKAALTEQRERAERTEAALAAKDAEIERLRDDLKWTRSELAKADAENRAAGSRAEEAERLAAEYRMQVDDPDSLLTKLDEAEAAVRRVREMAEAAKRESVASFARRITGEPFPARLLADDILDALDAEQPKETP